MKDEKWITRDRNAERSIHKVIKKKKTGKISNSRQGTPNKKKQKNAGEVVRIKLRSRQKYEIQKKKNRERPLMEAVVTEAPTKEKHQGRINK